MAAIRTLSMTTAAVAALAGLLACGGGGGGGSNASSPQGGTTAFQTTMLVSDQTSVAAHLDANLVNPWGIAYGPATPFWVANQGSGTSTAYDGGGAPPNPAIVVAIPSASANPPKGPTGIVYSGTSGFSADKYIFAALDGTISGWSSGASATLRVTVPGALYTGLALAANGASTLLYAANFGAGTIDVFDSNYAPAALGASAFQDAAVPSGYYPFNIQNLGGKLYVAYAQRDSSFRSIPGAGLGYVEAFNPDGTQAGFRIAQGGTLNAPWGLAMAPSSFGPMAGMLLVGNFGDGTITAYNSSGTSMGQLMGASGSPVAIAGLWALAPGNGASAGLTSQIYFTAGPSAETHGLFGTLSYGSSGGSGMGGGGGGGGY